MTQSNVHTNPIPHTLVIKYLHTQNITEQYCLKVVFELRKHLVVFVNFRSKIQELIVTKYS